VSVVGSANVNRTTDTALTHAGGVSQKFYIYIVFFDTFFDTLSKNVKNVF